MEALIRSRVARTSAVATLLVLGVWGLAPYVLSDVGTSAFVNAEVTRVATPISGVVSASLPREGVYIDKDEALELVTARTPDRTRLDDLERQFALKKAAIALVRNQVAEIHREQASLDVRSKVYHTAAVADLASRVERGDAEVRQCAAQLKDQELKREATRALAVKGFVSTLGLRSIEATYDALDQSCRAARASLVGLRNQLQAAGDGVYLADGQSDAPYAMQQRDRLLIREQELMAQLVDSQAAFTEVQAQLEQEQARYERSSHYRVVVPARHIVWTLQTRPGAELTEGEAVMELADCAAPFVTVTLPARKIENLSIGSPATVRLLGGNRWINGHVRRIVGGAAKQAQPLYAAALPASKGDSFTVEVAYDRPPAPDAPRSCDIGRPAEVRFGRSLVGRPPAVADLSRAAAG